MHMNNFRTALFAVSVVASLSAMATAQGRDTRDVLYIKAPESIYNQLTIVQSHNDGHTANIHIPPTSTQVPALSRGSITQVGLGQSLTLSVLGSGHLVDIAQSGRGHWGIVSTTGQNNSVSLLQTGTAHFASVTQNGIRNTVIIRQGN